MSTPATKPVITSSDAPSTQTVRVGTRKSALALRQADQVVTALRQLHPTVAFEVVGMQSTADKDKVTALYQFGSKGLWTNELEAELTAGRLDMVVHSLKDMPTALPQGLTLACVTAREDPRDVVVVRRDLAESESESGEKKKIAALADLPDGAVVGTSSVRRMAQIARRHPRLRFRDMRGNIDSRVRKLDAEGSEYSVLVLAAAGLLRMGQDHRIAQYLDSATPGGGMLHAVGQGGLGIETRADDARVLALLAPLESRADRLACEAERSLMRTLEGGCSIPIGVETRWEKEEEEKAQAEAEGGEKKAGRRLRMAATVVNIEGTEAADAEQTAEVETHEDAVEFGKRVAQQLVDNGAQKILDVINADREANRDKAQPWVPA